MIRSQAFCGFTSTRCLLLVLWHLYPSTTPRLAPRVSIAEARRLPLGTTVTVDGSITDAFGRL